MRGAPECLAVETGLWNDERVRLNRDHPLYAGALLAWSAQDHLKPGLYREFWSAQLTHWPLRQGPGGGTRAG
jgi:hypothetical protein